MEISCDGVDHSECVTVSARGRVYAGGEAGQIYEIRGDRAVEVASTGGLILGVACDAAGNVYACDVHHRCVWRMDVDTTKIEPFLVGCPGQPLLTPNFGAFAPCGTYYCSDSGYRGRGNGCIWVLRNGAAARWSSESRGFPNGLAVADGGRRLLVVESFPPAVVEIEVRSDGTAGPRQVVVELPGTVPDGVVLLEDGSFLITCYRPDAILLFQPAHGLQTLFSDPEGYLLAAPTNAVCVGPERRDLVVANFARRHLTRCTLDVAGERLHYPSI